MRNHRHSRRGAATVEVAVTLPVLLSLFVGAIEMSRAIMVQHALQEAAHAAARIYAADNTSLEDAQTFISVSMAQAGIEDYTTEFDPPSKSGITATMDPVSVNVLVPYSNVSWTVPNFMTSAVVRGSCTMPAELDDVLATTGDVYDAEVDDNELDGNERDDDKVKVDKKDDD